MKTEASSAQVPPQNIEAEESVLGAMLVAEPTLTRVIDEVKLNAEDFYLDKHRLIFTCVHDLYAASKPVDELSVAEALTQRNRIEEAGGKHYVSELATKVPAAGNAKHYAEIVQQNSLLRRLLGAGQRIIESVHARNGHDPAELSRQAEELLAQVRPAASDRQLRVLDVEQMVTTAPPEVPYVVHGLAVERTLTLISGREGEGKSLLAMALAAGVALGESVAGFECEQRRVLVVDAENGEYEIHRRVKTLGLPSEGVTVVEADDFHLGRDLGALEALIERERPGLVILDSFRSLWPGGEENDSGTVAAVLDPLRNMLRRQGPAGILLHHVSRSGNDYRGTSAIGAAIELGFRLARHPDDPEAHDRRFLRCFKCRPAPEPEDRWLRLHVERGQVFIEGTDPYASEASEEAPAAPVRAELAPGLLAAAAQPTTWPDLARAIDRSPKDGTARRLRDDLLAAGELEKCPDGRLRVPSGVAPLDSASESQLGEGCHGASTPIGAGEVAPPPTVEVAA